MEDKKVAILTTFQDADNAYSLNNVVQDQIKMLIRGGYKPVVIVMEGFQSKESYDLADLRFLPPVPCHNEVKQDETFWQDVDDITEKLTELLQDCQTVLTHDIVYQPAALKHNLAARKVADSFPSMKWLHWIHSATSPFTLIDLRKFFTDIYIEEIRKPFPNSKYVFFNEYSRPRIAANFGIRKENVAIVHHPVNVYEFLGLCEMTRKMSDQWKLLEADMMCVYPIRLDRGKQVEYVIKTMAQMKHYGVEAKTVIVDFHSTGGDKVLYRKELKGLSEGLGTEVYFTSEFSDETTGKVPRQVVRDLFLLSNVYIHPSVSESYSLTTQEAALCGNLVILNDDFPPMKSIYGEDALYRQYSSNIDKETGMDGETKTEYADEEMYHRQTAELIVKELRADKSASLRRMVLHDRNLDAVFKNELEPLL